MLKIIYKVTLQIIHNLFFVDKLNFGKAMILQKVAFVFLIFLFFEANSQDKAFDLKQSIEKVLRNHKTILASKTDIEAAKLRIKQSKGGYFPSLDVTANYGHENIIKYGPGNNNRRDCLSFVSNVYALAVFWDRSWSKLTQKHGKRILEYPQSNILSSQFTENVLTPC